jgi:hypothetical protein
MNCQPEVSPLRGLPPIRRAPRGVPEESLLKLDDVDPASVFQAHHQQSREYEANTGSD